MITLTEQWKQEGLILGKEYYIKLLNDEIYMATYQQRYDDHHWPSDLGFDVFSNKRIKEVLAPVPSYEEWFNQGDYVAYLEEENTKLEELLMSTRNYLKSYRDLYSKDNEDIVDFIKEIDQVLADNQIQADTVACHKIQENEE